MSDYRMNFGRVGGPNDTDKLYDMLDILGEDDQLIINIGSRDYGQADTIVSVLDSYNFDVETKGGHHSGEYNIIARRKES